MHYMIGLLVEGKNKIEALESAENLAFSLIERGEFDWHNDKAGSRWKECFIPYRLTSVKGQKLLTDGMQYTKNNFMDAMKAVRYIVANYTDEQIYNEEFDRNKKSPVYESRYQFHVASGMSMTYIYDQDGDRVESDKTLGYVTQAKMWIVCVDFHG